MSVYTFPSFLRMLMESGLEYFGVYYGIYRAEVKDNKDPKSLGRLKIQSSIVHGDFACENWAWPVSPWASKDCGMWAIPDIGDDVYVLFDHGRADQPIWIGGWWGKGELQSDMDLKTIVLATKEGMKIVMDRTNKMVLVEQANGNSVLMSQSEVVVKHSQKISIQSPTINLTGTVAINGNTTLTGDYTQNGNGQVNGNFYSTNNSAHHTHPVANGVAQRGNP